MEKLKVQGSDGRSAGCRVIIDGMKSWERPQSERTGLCNKCNISQCLWLQCLESSSSVLILTLPLISPVNQEVTKPLCASASYLSNGKLLVPPPMLLGGSNEIKLVRTGHSSTG